MSKFVELMIAQIEAIAVIAGSGGCVDSRIENIRQELIAREALLERMADALKELIAAGDDYKNPFADDIQKIIRFRHADEEACAVLDAYEGSKQ